MPNDNIVRGTTPTLKFTVPFSTEEIQAAFVTMKQGGQIVIDKEAGKDGCACNDKEISVTLTQDETLMLKACQTIEIQIRIKDKDGNAFASQIIKTFAEEIIKEGVI